MKKLLAWSKANPFLAVLGVAGIATGITLLIRAIINANKNGNDASNPNPPERVKEGYVELRRTVSPSFVVSGRPSMDGAGSAGMGGARVSASGNAR